MWTLAHLAALLLISAMLGMGTTLEPADFRRVFRAPQGVLLVLAMLLVAPSAYRRMNKPR